MPDRAFPSPEERLGEVRNLIAARGAVRIDQLAADFGVSEMTIRRACFGVIPRSCRP